MFRRCKDLLQKNCFSGPGLYLLSSKENLHLADLVTMGQHVYAVGGGIPKYFGSRVWNPNATQFDGWIRVANDSMISGNRVMFSTIVVPASIIPDLPEGCTGLQKKIVSVAGGERRGKSEQDPDLYNQYELN